MDGFHLFLNQPDLHRKVMLRTNSNCRKEKRARGTSLLSLTKLVVFKIRGSALQSAFEIIDFTERCD